ncbi:tetratricopeptide repeat protein [Microvirga splendida]|uniref:Tetratricopeptide repeat protein n=1 Tax=Microvirga splendida TaxID=2795727 RepID=A0ABS0Y0T0_9HYPH|nr:tetratricopeptide repeat protein [Microvirga splendida]MBJ6125909.1 tetratricopeptide repeat protein [Microvirga splendida]
MTTFDAHHRCRSSRSALLAATAVMALLAGGAAHACPLGSHDSPRVRMLHALQTPNHHGSGHHMSVAQLQPQAKDAQPKRTELGTYGRDLPRGAAAPTSDTRPPLRDNLGTLAWAVTKDPGGEAQAYFNQGYRLGWGFNHAEAARAFRAAQELDPDCAMCLWGEAWVLGPHINYPMDADANARALAVLEKARDLAPAQGDMQVALVEALSKRHSPDPKADRKALDQAYADAMEAVQARFPNDPHVAVLTADALMNLTPWDYWADGGKTPKGKTDKIVALLEGVLGTAPSSSIAADPDHPGAVHLYIHTVEASDRPERAAPHAARLESLMPGAGHLVHMPSHIWYRLGRWRESLDANVRAAAADEDIMKQGGASLLYSEAYYAHNVHFVMVSALTGGDGATAVDAARKLSGIVSERAQREVPWTQPIMAAPYNAHAVFSKPEDVLALPAPKGDFPYVKAAWHYARGVALARLGRADEARAEAAAIEALAQTPEITALPDVGVPGPDVLSIAVREIDARIAQQAGDQARAASLFAEAASVQDRLPYMEPPYWYYPVHQSLGAALMAQGKSAEAATAFREALQRSPNNGWAAAGLLRAAEAQGDQATVEEARSLMQKNWFGTGMPAPEQL